MGIGAEQCAVRNPGLLEYASMAHQHPVSNLRVLNDGVGAYAAVAADARRAAQLNKRFNHSVGSYFDITVDDAGLRIENTDAVRHQLRALGRAHALIDVHEFGARVAAEHFVRMIGGYSDNALFRLAQDGGHVGEVELSVRIISAKAVDVSE